MQAFGVQKGKIEASGKCRTWYLTGANGKRIAEITAKRDAKMLADTLNEVARHFGQIQSEKA